MATYTVNRVKKHWASDGVHKHIAGVYTTDGTYWSRSEVVASINLGNYWQTSYGGHTAKIHVIRFCRAATCLTSPYITTSPDSTTVDNLDKLPEG